MIRQKAQPYVIIEVRGGVVQEVWANRRVQLVVVDWDDIHARQGNEKLVPRLCECRIDTAKIIAADKAVDAKDITQFINVMEGT